jgi:hypothetical protein
VAVGISGAQAAKAIDALVGNATFTTGVDPWIQLHTGDPGAAGTSNVAGSQDATYFTAWSLAAGGVFWFSGTITANAYVAGDTFNVAVGAMSVQLTVAS